MHVGDSYPKKSQGILHLNSFEISKAKKSLVCRPLPRYLHNAPWRCRTVKGGLRRLRLHVGFWSVWTNPNYKQSRTMLDVFRCSKCSICDDLWVYSSWLFGQAQCGWTTAWDFRQCVSSIDHLWPSAKWTSKKPCFLAFSWISNTSFFKWRFSEIFLEPLTRIYPSSKWFQGIYSIWEYFHLFWNLDLDAQFPMAQEIVWHHWLRR